MPLSFNEIRTRAAKFAKDWENAHYENGQTQTFYNEFFEVFGKARKNVAVYEKQLISVHLTNFENKKEQQMNSLSATSIFQMLYQYQEWAKSILNLSNPCVTRLVLERFMIELKIVFYQNL